MEEENELIVKDDVPETSQEEQIETNASEGVDGVQTTDVVKTEDDIEKQIEERANKIAEEKIEARLIRDRVKREREEAQSRAKYEELENIMKTALGATDIDDVLNKSKEFYREQGVTIPEIINKSSLSERDEKILAREDAKEIISLGKSEMESEANRIASIPQDKRTLRENIIFDEVCSRLMDMRDEDALKQKGYDTEILSNQDFGKFRGQFNRNTPLASIVDMYQKINGTKKVQPNSPGSARTSNTDNEVKEYYTPEEAREFTMEELNNNPKLMAAIDRSMLQWYKSK